MDTDGPRPATKKELDPAVRLAVPLCPQCTKQGGTQCTIAGCDQTADGTERLFRCYKCKRGAHYGCLEHLPEDYHQDWLCDDCVRWGDNEVDAILAWRAPGSSESDAPPKQWDLPKLKDLNADAEYLGAPSSLISNLSLTSSLQ